MWGAVILRGDLLLLVGIMSVSCFKAGNVGWIQYECPGSNHSELFSLIGLFGLFYKCAIDYIPATKQPTGFHCEEKSLQC